MPLAMLRSRQVHQWRVQVIFIGRNISYSSHFSSSLIAVGAAQQLSSKLTTTTTTTGAEQPSRLPLDMHTCWLRHADAT